jgi:hypothetical protein
MRQRGRKSSSDLAVVIPGDFGKRPDPPDNLTERQAEIWRETVASEPPEFFRTAAARALLADYCRHRQAAEDVSALINEFEPAWLKRPEGAKQYHALSRIREIETRASMTMARSLRMTNHSRYTADTVGTAARNAAQGPKPWEV